MAHRFFGDRLMLIVCRTITTDRRATSILLLWHGFAQGFRLGVEVWFKTFNHDRGQFALNEFLDVRQEF